MERIIGVLIVFAMVWVSSQAAVNCDNYNPVICPPDLKLVCLLNGTMMMGTCEAQAAICGEGAKEASDMGCCTGTAECRALNTAIKMYGASILLSAATAVAVILCHWQPHFAF